MWLIADSGGSKTDWSLVEQQTVRTTRTRGLNPNLTDWPEIKEVLHGPVNDWVGKTKPEQIFFFGAGLAAPEARGQMEGLLRGIAPENGRVAVKTDLEGAGIACFGSEPGIVGALGTGSVAFVWKSGKVHKRAGGLGFLLGDEGGGVSLGKALYRLVISGKVSPPLGDAFFAHTKTTPASMVRKLYNHPSPPAYLAGLPPLLVQHRNLPEIQAMLDHAFRAFFEKTLLPLSLKHDFRIRFMGGIAQAFRPELETLCRDTGLKQADFLGERPIVSLTRRITGQDVDTSRLPC